MSVYNTHKYNPKMMFIFLVLVVVVVTVYWQKVIEVNLNENKHTKTRNYILNKLKAYLQYSDKAQALFD